MLLVCCYDLENRLKMNEKVRKRHAKPIPVNKEVYGFPEALKQN